MFPCSSSYTQSLPYQIDRSTFPCSANGFGPNHGILSVPEGQVLVHGQKLICDHDECKASKRSFLYCAFGNHAFSADAFRRKHKCIEGKVLCPYFIRNGFGTISHSGATLSPKRGEALTHKGELICSHEKCRNSGKSSLYCAHCKDGVPEESFFDKSKHKCKD